MSNTVVAELSRIPMSANLAATLSRATDYARQQAHLEVTLEHLLLALIEDPEAGLVLTASRVDIGRLAADVSGHLGRIEERAARDQPSQLVVASDLRRILEAAAAAAQQGRRRDINGAIVLAAVVGDGRSTAAHLLSAHGLTFQAAIDVLQRAAAMGSSPGAAGNNGQSPSSAGGEPSAAHEPTPPRSPAATTAEAAPAPAPPTTDVAGIPAAAVPATDRPTAGRGATSPAPSPAPSMDDLLAVARERVRKRHMTAEPDSGSQPPTDAEATPAELVPNRQQPAAHAKEYRQQYTAPEPPQPRMPPVTEADQASRPGPGATVGTAPGAAPGVAGPASAQPGSPPRPQVHPHRPLPQDRGSHAQGQPQPPPSGGWIPAQPASQQGSQAAPPQQMRVPHQPPPLPMPPRAEAVRPGAIPRGPMPPSVEEVAQDLRRTMPQSPQSLPHGMPPGAPGGARPASPLGAPPAQGPPPNRVRSPTAGGRETPPGSPSPSAPGTSPMVEIGQLVENIPKTMRVAVPQRIEVRIGKASVKALAEGLQGGGAAWRHEVTVTKAMSVRLRAPEGGFYIESASPETQWIENALGLMADDYASWRWTVTPRTRGWKRLQLIVSARTVGADGLAAETAMPDQVIDVKVRTNYGRAAMTAGGWIAAAVVGGILAKFGEGAFAELWKAAVRQMTG